MQITLAKERAENQSQVLVLKLELVEKRAKAAEQELEVMRGERDQVLCLQQQQQLVPLDNSAEVVVCVRRLVCSFFFGSLLRTRDAYTT